MNRSLARLSRSVATTSVLALAACSSATTATQRTESTYIPGAGLLSVTSENGTIAVVMGAPLQQVWRILPTAFDSAGITLTLIDPKKHLMANEGFKIRQTCCRGAPITTAIVPFSLVTDSSPAPGM